MVWAISRTTGLPVGPAPWRPEPVGAIDSIATADELTLALLVWIYGVRGVGGRVRAALLALRSGVKAGALVLVVLSTLGLLGAGHTS